jgi:hypothetical protein
MAEILKNHIAEALEPVTDEGLLDLIYKIILLEGGEKVCCRTQNARGPSRKR